MIRFITIVFLLFVFNSFALAEEMSQPEPVKAEEGTDNKTAETLEDQPQAEKEAEKKEDAKSEEEQNKAVTSETANTDLSAQQDAIPMNRQETIIEELEPENSPETKTKATESVIEPEGNTSEKDSEETKTEQAAEETAEETTEDEDYQSSWEGNDEGDKADDTPADPDENRVRLEIFGGALIPATGQDVAGGVGGMIAYDFWDKLGVELYLNQCWGDTKLDVAGKNEKVSSSLKILSVRPGIRYRFHRGELFRFYVSAHGGLEQVSWKKPDYGDKYENNFSLDAGLGGELLFSNMWLVNIFANYFTGIDVMPSTTDGDLKKYHGAFIGLALGVSAPSSKVFSK